MVDRPDNQSDEMSDSTPVQQPSVPETDEESTSDVENRALTRVKDVTASDHAQPDERFVRHLGKAVVLGVAVGAVVGALGGLALVPFLDVTTLAAIGVVLVGAALGSTIGGILVPVAASPQSEAGEPSGGRLIRDHRRPAGESENVAQHDPRGRDKTGGT